MKVTKEIKMITRHREIVFINISCRLTIIHSFQNLFQQTARSQTLGLGIDTLIVSKSKPLHGKA